VFALRLRGSSRLFFDDGANPLRSKYPHKLSSNSEEAIENSDTAGVIGRDGLRWLEIGMVGVLTYIVRALLAPSRPPDA